MTSETKSLIVVIIGPDAVAGSTLNLFKKIGTRAPIDAEINILKNVETPTTKAMLKAD